MSQYSTIKQAWPSCSNRVSVTETTFANSKVDLATPTLESWNSKYGALITVRLYGVTELKSTDDYIVNANNAKYCSGFISYANILFNPTSNYYRDVTHRRFVMVHELGHVLCLGHPNKEYYPTTAPSVMRQDTEESYYLPQTHDINDLNNKY